MPENSASMEGSCEKLAISMSSGHSSEPRATSEPITDVEEGKGDQRQCRGSRYRIFPELPNEDPGPPPDGGATA